MQHACQKTRQASVLVSSLEVIATVHVLFQLHVLQQTTTMAPYGVVVKKRRSHRKTHM